MARKQKQDDDGGEAMKALAVVTISTGEFAKLVGMTSAAVGLRVSAGFIPRAGHGKLNLVQAVQGFIRYEAELAAKAKERAKASGRARINAARADEITARLAREARGLIDRQEAEDAISEVVAISVKAMRAFSRRLPPELPRDEVKAEIGASCARLEKARAVLIGALRTGDIEGAKL